VLLGMESGSAAAPGHCSRDGDLGRRDELAGRAGRVPDGWRSLPGGSCSERGSARRALAGCGVQRLGQPMAPGVIATYH
jgi:hypothetical protein